MWETDVLDHLQAVYEGKEGAALEQSLLREYMMFYGMRADEPGNQHYSFGYQSVMDMFSGKKRNPFACITYAEGMGTLIPSRTVYVKD